MKKDSSTTNDQNNSETKSEFDPLDESLFKHINLGVWDFYIMRIRRLSWYLPTSWKIEEYARIWKDVPYLWRTLHETSRAAWPLLLLYLVITLVKSLIPALSLWCARLFPFLKAKGAYRFSRFSGQLLGIVSIYPFPFQPP